MERSSPRESPHEIWDRLPRRIYEVLLGLGFGSARYRLTSLTVIRRQILNLPIDWGNPDRGPLQIALYYHITFDLWTAAADPTSGDAGDPLGRWEPGVIDIKADTLAGQIEIRNNVA